MEPVLRRLTMVVVMMMALLSSDPASGAWYPPGQHSAGWLQYGGRGLWLFHVFQQQQIYQLETQVNELKQQTSHQRQEIDQLKPLQGKVKLLETIVGVNLTADGANLTDLQPSILQRLTTLEGHQADILTQQGTFQQQHELHNGSMQNLSDDLESLEAVVNRNTENITEIHAILEEQAHHSVLLQSLFDNVESHASIIGGPLNDSSATLVSSLAKVEAELEKNKVILIANNATLQSFETPLAHHTDQLSAIAEDISDIEDRVTSVESELQLLKQTKRVGFSVRCSSCDEVDSRDHIIKYDDVKTNIGDRYSTDTGCFLAEYSGLYVFFTSLRSNDDSNITVGILNDQGNRFLTEVTADGGVHPWNSGSALVTTRVEAGSKVCVAYVRGDNAFDSSGFTTFSGWLVDADD